MTGVVSNFTEATEDFWIGLETEGLGGAREWLDLVRAPTGIPSALTMLKGESHGFGQAGSPETFVWCGAST